MRRAGGRRPSGVRVAASRRSGGFISVGLVLAVTAGLVGTVLGVGATSHTLNVADGDVWLWSSKPANVSRVNTNSGRVDSTQPLLDSRGHRVEVTQNDKYLLLHDLDAGKVTSVDLTRMGFTGSLSVTKGPGVRVALAGDKGVLINQKTGKIRGFDPENLHTTGASLQLPAPLVGGDFDADGHLWVGVPSQGTVVSATFGTASASARRTETVGPAGHRMALTVLDHGALTADTDGHRISVVTKDVVNHTTTEPLSGAVLPERTVGSTAAVTLPKPGQVLPIPVHAGADDTIGPFALPRGVTPGAATPFSGRFYVPDAKRHKVYVFSSSGKSLGTLGLSGAQGPLEIQVREQHLVINAPDASVARVVDTDGVTRVVDKYQANEPGDDGDLSVIAAPAPGKSGDQGDGGADGHGKHRGGSDSGHHQQVHGPPGPPIPVSASPADERVELSWPQPSTNGAPVEHYDISWAGGHHRVDGDTRSWTVTGLTNGKTYSFAVKATNRYGTGPQALSDRVTPKSEAPPGKPTDVIAKPNPSKPDSIILDWTAPSDHGSKIDRYKLTTSTGVDKKLPASQHRYTIGNLKPGTRVTLTVAAHNANGLGPVATAATTAGEAPTIGAVKASGTTKALTFTPSGFSDGGATATCQVLFGSTKVGQNDCSGPITVVKLRASSSYPYTFKASNQFGGNKKTGTAKTNTVRGQIHCENTDKLDDPHYCDKGVGKYSVPQQADSKAAGHAKNNTSYSALCQAGDLGGKKLVASYRNSQKESTQWVMLPDGNYVPFIWFNIGGSTNTGPINQLSTCQ